MNPDVIVPIFFFGGTAVVLWKYIDSRHRERMTILDKGLVKEDLKYLYARSPFRPHPLSSLKYGLLALFIGAGILLSTFLTQIFYSDKEPVTAGTIFITGGLGLILFYVIANKKLHEEEGGAGKE